MKRIGNLFNKVTQPSIIRMAHELSKLGKAHYAEVKMVDSNPDYFCEQIRHRLVYGKHKTSSYVKCEKFDGRKNRVIHKLPYYPDRIIQTAIVIVCRDLWVKSMIRDTFQSIPKRGTSDARRRVLKAMESKPKYALKLDIKKYYPSVDNGILKQILRKKIKDNKFLLVLDELVDSMKGLPIGNYTSQFFGNLYLTPFDWWLKQEVGVKYYYRYCDDMIILHDSKEFLHQLKKDIDVKLLEYKLSLKDNWQIYNIKKEGIDFCGYRFYHDYTLLRSSIKKKFKKRALHIKKHHECLSDAKVLNSIMSYWGWVKYASAKNLWRKVVDSWLINIIKRRNPKIKAQI
jgi:hypothetical protein